MRTGATITVTILLALGLAQGCTSEPSSTGTSVNLPSDSDASAPTASSDVVDLVQGSASEEYTFDTFATRLRLCAVGFGLGAAVNDPAMVPGEPLPPTAIGALLFDANVCEEMSEYGADDLRGEGVKEAREAALAVAFYYRELAACTANSGVGCENLALGLEAALDNAASAADGLPAD